MKTGRDFEFRLEGRTVRPGQELHVHPLHWAKAGPSGKAEIFHGDAVTLRTDNGAVPTVPLSALSWKPHPQTVALEELRQAGFTRPTLHDVDVWCAARKFVSEEVQEAAPARRSAPR